MNINQKHLNHIDAINLGSYYTPEVIVDLTYSILQKNIKNIKDFSIIDSSCGYGSFLARNNIARRLIGADIDQKAISEAKKIIGEVDFICQNSLLNVSRPSLTIKNDEKIITIGNPPYNDTTSIIRNSIKDTSIQDKIDADIKTRDLGMSFLLSYNKLKADYVCVLHPLSYLIKKANFALLSKFAKNYIASFGTDYLFLTGDTHKRQGFGTHGNFYYLDLLFIVFLVDSDKICLVEITNLLFADSEPFNLLVQDLVVSSALHTSPSSNVIVSPNPLNF